MLLCTCVAAASEPADAESDDEEEEDDEVSVICHTSCVTCPTSCVTYPANRTMCRVYRRIRMSWKLTLTKTKLCVSSRENCAEIVYSTLTTFRRQAESKRNGSVCKMNHTRYYTFTQLPHSSLSILFDFLLI